MTDAIIIRGARENNLQSIDVDIPRGQFVVITGLSGSGKSSLAFDTIYAEGQRRYVESLSAYARQFLERMARPDVDTIEGLSPAISIEQRGLGRNPRSTVGTVTEIYDYLRLLFARVGQPHCHGCGRLLEPQTVPQMVKRLYDLPERSRLSVLAPVVRGRKGEFRSLFDQLRRDGFNRVNVDGELRDLSEDIALNARRRHDIEVYVDRLVLKPDGQSRLSESLELALKLAGGLVKVSTPDAGGDDGQDMLFSERAVCHDCGLDGVDLSPRLFSFNGPHGACPRCSGLGVLLEFDETLIVPNWSLSLREGAVEPWELRSSAHYQQLFERVAEYYDFSMVNPYGDLSARVRELLMRGGQEEIEFSLERGGKKQTYERSFEGVVPNLQRRMLEQQRRRREGAAAGSEQEDVSEEFYRYMRSLTCPDCEGTRLRPEARHVLLGGLSIDRVSSMSVAEGLRYFEQLEWTGKNQPVADKLVAEVRSRLSFLAGVGVGYLTLDRSASTLSGGEGQRVRLATQIGASLVGVLYILDEPSIGLHQRDKEQLLSTLLRLRDQGNSVLVVEHDEDTIRAADYIVDLGPGAGIHGGHVVAAGPLTEVMDNPRSLTGQYLSGAKRMEVPRRRRRGGRSHLTIRGARHNNLKGIDVAIPLNVLVCVTGVSGSGKSSLIVDTLLPALRQSLHGARDSAGAHDSVDGVRHLDKVVAIDQNPIGRTPRSNPATYTGLFALIRDLFAGLPEARMRGYRAGRFSFNVKGGRCEACRGDGVIRMEMHFLPDVFVSCEECSGRRYNEETLRVQYRGRSIADVLEMSVDEALSFLANVPRVREKLATLHDVGLGYLALGQPASTLSGGEAQRVKLSRELSRRSSGRSLYVLDEPTTGLHFADIHLLLDVLAKLVDAGNTVIVIEHNMEVIKCADYVVDLGPEGGDRGGQLVAAGVPEKLAEVAGSHTGYYLAELLRRSGSGPAARGQGG